MSPSAIAYSCSQPTAVLQRQRVYALALGYEDLNDHQTLRLDLPIQTALECTGELASSPALCRWENRADRETAVRMHAVIVEQFIAKIEHTGKGSNPRYVVTNLQGDGKALYDKLYCARGEMENRI